MTHTIAGEDNIVFPRLAKLVACGYDITQEPLLAICLGAIQAWMARDMRNKTHVFLEDGCRLLGVMDETASLQRGQVFLQVQRHRDEPPAVLTGPVLVTRNPCLHPGDVLRLEVGCVYGGDAWRRMVVHDVIGVSQHRAQQQTVFCMYCVLRTVTGGG